jgi:hemoglobin-like flavoprotein
MSLNIALLRESFEAIKPHALEVMDHFYGELFSKHPEAKPLFAKVDMSKQKLALANGLSHIVEYLHEEDHLVDYLTKMGARHAQYGTKEVHFTWVGEALLKTFEYYFDEHWTPELKAEWTSALTLVASVMIKGMKGKIRVQTPVVQLDTKGEQSLQDLAKALAYNIVKQALQEEINESLMNEARKQVREVLRKAMAEEARNALDSVSQRKSA